MSLRIGEVLSSFIDSFLPGMNISSFFFAIEMTGIVVLPAAPSNFLSVLTAVESWPFPPSMMMRSGLALKEESLRFFLS